VKFRNSRPSNRDNPANMPLRDDDLFLEAFGVGSGLLIHFGLHQTGTSSLPGEKQDE